MIAVAAPRVPARDAWIDANQAFLAAEFARLGALIEAAADGGTAADGVERAPTGAIRSAVRDVERARRAMPGEPAIDALAGAFGLSPFERDVALLCAGVELDSALAATCAAVGRAGSTPAPTFGLALAALPDAHWSAIAPGAPLRHWPLVTLAEGASPTTAPLRIVERVLHFLAGVNALDRSIAALVREAEPPELMAARQRSVAAQVAERWAVAPGSMRPVHLAGDDATGREDVAARGAEGVGLALFVLRADEIPPAPRERAQLAAAWSRESVLLGAALLVEVADEAPAPAVLDFVRRVHGPVAVSSRMPAPDGDAGDALAVDRPTAAEQRDLWRATLGDELARRLAPEIGIVAGHVRMGARAIVDAGQRARAAADAGQAPSLVRTTQVAARRGPLDELAQRIDPRATWDDLVLPDDRVAMLREIGAQVRHRTTVYDDWGFGRQSARGLGISVLFAGESGTGKTMAAEVLAGELGLDLYRIDLSSVVSKYIGETEKNLRAVFDAADASGAILLFDEADALFGRRSEVRDSHDRYANIEVSYLLQRMEAYRGLAILTTNAKAALDRAFQRRLRFIVGFPFPDAAGRRRLWQAAFPPAVPTSGLDVDRLATLQLSGGAIRNIALVAAFRAAEAGRRVTMRGIADAARAELAKAEKVLSDGSTRGWT